MVTIQRVWRVMVAGALLSLGGASGFCADTQFFRQVEIPSSFNPVGSGARALGMGGAFIAIADDATAASWNPGGLVQLELPEISIVGKALFRAEENHIAASPSTSRSTSEDENISQVSLNYLSAALPFQLWGRNMIVSANYQHLYDFDREWRFPLESGPDLLSTDQLVRYDQDGQLAAYGLAYGVQITPAFSVGVTFNFWEDGITTNHWEQETYQTGAGVSNGDDFRFDAWSTDEFDLSGFNVNFGLLWNTTPKLTVGGVFKTPFDANVTHKRADRSVIHYPGDESADSEFSASAVSEDTLTMPASFGIGIAYKFTNQFTGALDIYRTAWDDFELEGEDGGVTSPITGEAPHESDIDPTYQVRLGMEYLFKRSDYFIPIRAGLFYDPAPAPGSPDDLFGLSLGTGVAVRRMTFDIAYQFRFGNDVGESILEEIGFSQDVREHTFFTSAIFHF